jgi:hypothetical protein
MTVEATVTVEEDNNVPSVPVSSSSVASSDALHSGGVAFLHLLFPRRQIGLPALLERILAMHSGRWRGKLDLHIHMPMFLDSI